MGHRIDTPLSQHPHTIFIMCSDSPLDLTQMTAWQPGEALIIRNVGNFIPPWHPRSLYSENAAISFGLSHFNIKQMIVCGHSHCLAMYDCARYEDEALPAPLDHWMGLIHSQIPFHPHHTLDEIIGKHILNQVVNIQKHPLVQDKLQAGKLSIKAWFFDVNKGLLREWNKDTHRFETLRAPACEPA